MTFKQKMEKVLDYALNNSHSALVIDGHTNCVDLIRVKECKERGEEVYKKFSTEVLADNYDRKENRIDQLEQTLDKAIQYIDEENPDKKKERVLVDEETGQRFRCVEILKD